MEMSLKRLRIKDANISRIMGHGEHGFVVIPTNRQFLPLLIQDIRNVRYNFSLVYGGCHNGQEVDESEPSVIVYNRHYPFSDAVYRWEDLLKFAARMCVKFHQEVVYVYPSKDVPACIHVDGRTIPFETELPFKSMYLSDGPGSYVDRIRRTQYGELFIDQLFVHVEEYRRQMDRFRFLIVENWCLCKYCQLYEPENKDFKCWAMELKTCISKLKYLGVTNRANKKKLISKMLVTDSDYDAPHMIERIAGDRLQKEGLYNAEQNPHVYKAFADNVSKLVEVIACDTVEVDSYIGDSFTIDKSVFDNYYYEYSNR